jgi:hypothetical protein
MVVGWAVEVECCLCWRWNSLRIQSEGGERAREFFDFGEAAVGWAQTQKGPK